MAKNNPPVDRYDFSEAYAFGYFSCCGRSKLRGHWEGCHRHPMLAERETQP